MYCFILNNNLHFLIAGGGGDFTYSYMMYVCSLESLECLVFLHIFIIFMNAERFAEFCQKSKGCRNNE